MDDELTVGSLNSAEHIDSARLLTFLENLDASSSGIETIDIDTIAGKINLAELGKADFARLLTVLDRLREDGAPVEVSRIDPSTFARLLANVSKAQLADVFARPPLRALIFDEIFRRMGTHLRADRAAEVRAVVHWRFTGGEGEDGYDRYETVISDGTCSASRQMSRRASVTISLSPADFLQLIIGKASPPVLFMTGKLKVKGDLALAAGLMGMFDLPRA